MAVQWIAEPAAATGGASDRALGRAIIAGLAVSGGLLAGFAAVARQVDRQRAVRDWLALAVGPLLVALGVAAMVSAAGTDPALAGVAGGVGTVCAWAVSDRATDGDPTSDPPGAISLHRAVEGTALAGGYVAGSAIGLLGAIVLASHATADAAAVGGLYGTSSVRTTSRTVLLQGGFLAGAVAGLAFLGSVPPVGRLVALAAAGGVLVSVGAVETATHAPWPPPDRTDPP